ncbi:MAG: BspA family leucine-rich repeat surface protein [Saprospiraceae bacterium]
MDCNNYSNTLIGWSNNPATPNGRSLGASGRQYGTNAAAARTNLDVTKTWTFSGDTPSGTACVPTDAFITTWKTDNPGTSNSTSITIPTTGGGYNYEVDWNNDGTYDQSGINGSVTHDFGAAGTYTIRIRGSFPQIYFNNDGDRQKLLDISQWGSIAWASMFCAFWGCSNLNITATDLPNLSGVTNMSTMFRGCTALNGPTNIGSWNTATVTGMSAVFAEASAFNQPIGNWSTAAVTDMAGMFSGASSFNQPIGTWNTAAVNNMNTMFYGASAFNQPIGTWNTAAVNNMSRMFWLATAFNEPIGTWNTANVTTMEAMFHQATAFNQPLANWNTAAVTDMRDVFSGASAFNMPIGNWNTAAATTMRAMFYAATAFNQPIGSWNTAAVTDMTDMFSLASSFNQPIGNWSTGAVTTMSFMFYKASAFNQPIGNWNTGAVTTMRYMFFQAGSFNQSIANWNTAAVANMSSMFQQATAFNQPIGSWNTAAVNTMQNMFSSATAFNQPISNWNTAAVTDMREMFVAASAFNQPLGTWTLNAAVNLANMLDNCGMDCANYSSTLIGWNNNPATPNGRSLGAIGRKYQSSATAARTNLDVTKSWTITGDALSTSANAGPDQTGATTCGLATVTLAANSPSPGTGVWSVVSGTGGSFGTASSPSSTFSGNAGATYTLRWTVTDAPCTSTDDVVITFNQNPTVTCPTNMSTHISDPAFALTGGSPSGGTYSGTGVSGGNFNPATAGGGTHTITYSYTSPAGCSGTCTFSITVNTTACPSNSTVCISDAPFALTGGTPTGGTYSGTGVSGGNFNPATAGAGTHTITYTNGASCTFSITVRALPSTASAGPDQTGAATCGQTQVTLAANSPTVGTGTWSIQSGTGGSLGTPGSPTSTFSGTAGNTYTLRWTVTNSPCAASTDEMTVTFNQNPTTANAGADQTGAATCGQTQVTLAANSPTIGTGTWSIQSGAGGSFGNASSPTSTFSGTAGNTYTLRWTVTNAPCAASTDEMTVTFNQNPTTANAGADQTGAATCGQTQVTLAANSPSVGTGTWSIQSGAGGSFGNANSPTSTFSGTAGTAYVLRWTISNSPCTASTDDVAVTFNRNPTAANAGPDQTGAATCGQTQVTLAANTPTIGTGAWSIVSGTGGSFGNAASPSSTFSGNAGTTYTLRWTISNPPCSPSTDDVVVTFNQNPNAAAAGPDQTVCGSSATLAANSPSIGTGAWTQVSGPGTANFGATSSPTSSVSVSATGVYTLRWTVTNSPCAASPDEMVVTFNQAPSFSNCPPGVTVSATSGCSATATYTAAAASTTPAATVTYTFVGATTGSGSGTGSGQTFNLGTTTVSLTATNSCGTSSCSFSVVVQTPEINVQGNGTDIVVGDATPSLADHTDFGQTTGAPVVRTFTVQNTGAVSLPVTGISITGPGMAMFSAGPLTPSGPVAPNGSATFTVTYSSGTVGTQTATVNIANGDCDEATYDFAVMGELTCSPPAFAACPSAVSLNTGAGNCSAAATYTVEAGGLPAPNFTYTFTGATTGSGNGTGSGSTFQKGATMVSVTATNPCGNPACSFTVTVTDNELPGITCPAAVSVTCSASVPAVNLAAVSATDNCGTPTKTHVGDATSNQTCANRKTVTRTYRATDSTGNSTTCSQVITVFDDVLPVFTSVPANVTVQCNSVPAAGTATASDGCGGAVTVAYNGQATTASSCPAAYTLTRQWTATDACGNTKTATQRVTVVDTQKPNFTSTPANVTVQCNAVPEPASPTATDNCDSAVAVTYVGQTSTAGTCPNAYTITRTWVAADDCGNTKTVTQRVNVVDNVKPVFTALPADGSLSCTENPPAVGSPTASDGCGGSVTITYLGQTTVSGSCPGTYQLRRTWRATDACGNSTAANQTIQVSDNGAPVFTSVPAAITISCTQAPPPLTNPTATDACGYASVTFLGNVASGSGCSADYTITRTWRATDLCGNSATCSQVITVQGNNYGEEETENRATDDKQFIAPRTSILVNPNPTSDRIWVDLSAFADQAVTVSIFSDLGQLVWETRISAVEELKLQVSLLQAGAKAGIYTVRVRSTNGVASKRVVLVE